MEKYSNYNLLGSIGKSNLSKEEVDTDIAFINKNFDLPTELSADDVYIRECWLTGNAINCYFGRFRDKDLKILLELVNGAPLMDSHKKGGYLGLGQIELPLGKFFGGSVRSRMTKLFDGTEKKVKYIVPKFYWMRNVSVANDLKTNIDGGIWNQASISWTAEKVTCSVCGKDIRLCNHVPGEKDSKGETIFYYYDNILGVSEGSIVYAGGHPGTGFGLAYNSENPIKKRIITLKYNDKIIKYGMPVK